jgi:hypothetical protein
MGLLTASQEAGSMSLQIFLSACAELPREHQEAAIRARCETDPLLFFHYAFGDEFVDASAPWQIDLVHDLADPVPSLREGATTFRGGAKTSLIEKWVAWSLCYRKPWAKFIPYVSGSSDLAVEKTADIATTLQENETCRRWFGEAFDGDPARADWTTRWGQRVIALGIGSKFRGRVWHGSRPTCAILDDIEAGAEETSRADRNRALAWYKRKIANAMSPEGIIIAIGNRVHEDGLMTWLLKNPEFHSRVIPLVMRWPDNTELWEECRRTFIRLEDEQRVKHAREFYEAHREEMVAGGSLAWPQRFDWFRDVYRKMWSVGRHAFSAEYQCDVSGVGAGVIPKDSLIWSRWEEKDRTVFLCEDAYQVDSGKGMRVPRSALDMLGYWDPSAGTGTGDYWAITTMARDRFGYLHVPETLMSQEGALSKQAVALWDAAARWGWQYIGIETDTFGAAAVAAETEQETRRRSGRYWRADIVPVRQRAGKRGASHRLLGLEQPLVNGWLRPVRGGPGETCIQQVLAIPDEHGHDDGPDSWEGALQVARRQGWLQ